MGIRTLAPSDSRYQGHYTGNVAHRDAAYHMGTSWPWLLGVFVRTHLNVHNDKPTAQKLIAPFVEELERRGLGSLSEVHDGDPPFAPGGTIAQAWSVGEILALCLETSEAPNP
jgi:glycogen debranching enzyme